MRRLSVFASIFPLFINQVFGELIQASVGEDVTFPLSEECKKGRGALNLHLKDASTQLVASLDSNWKPGRAYIDRVIVSNDCLILKSVDFNEEGLYEFTCKNKGKTELTDLQVFLPSEVVVPAGEDAILPCRSTTAGQSVKSVRWRRDGELVIQFDPPAEKITYGNGFNERRVSIPPDWKQRADLSLTIKRAEAKDEGIYYCDMDKAEKHRAAVRLQVREIIPKSLTSTLQPTPPLMPPECPYWTWTTFFITAAILIVGLVAWYLMREKLHVCT